MVGIIISSLSFSNDSSKKNRPTIVYYKIWTKQISKSKNLCTGHFKYANLFSHDNNIDNSVFNI